MPADYRNKLTDLGISDKVVEEIQELNEEYFQHSLGYASFRTDYPEYVDSEPYEIYGAEFTESQEHYLRTEGFIKCI